MDTPIDRRLRRHNAEKGGRRRVYWIQPKQVGAVDESVTAAGRQGQSSATPGGSVPLSTVSKLPAVLDVQLLTVRIADY